MGGTDPFATLGLGPDATSEEIRTARRRLAKVNHPDQGGDPVAMQRINEAADAALLTAEAGFPRPRRPELPGPTRRSPARPEAALGRSSVRDGA